MRRFDSFAEFWPYYLREHSVALNRRLHFAGTLAALLLLIAGLISHPAWLLAVPPAGYGPAWAGHFFIERNRPATFTHPWWSLRGDFYMAWLMISGRLERERARLGLA